jgi:hypothetical protein
MPSVEASELKVNAILSSLQKWKTGPRPPSAQKFNLTVSLLIERLQALEIGDDSWEDEGWESA